MDRSQALEREPLLDLEIQHIYEVSCLARVRGCLTMNAEIELAGRKSLTSKFGKPMLVKGTQS